VSLSTNWSTPTPQNPWISKDTLMTDVCVPPQYQDRVNRRLAVVTYATEHGIKPAGRHFGLARRTVRTWVRRWRADGAPGLVPQYPRQRQRRLAAATIELIRIARLEYGWGAPRTRLWLERDHALTVNARTIQRVFRDIGMPVLAKQAGQPPAIAEGEQTPPGDELPTIEAAL
jgi:transposase